MPVCYILKDVNWHKGDDRIVLWYDNRIIYFITKNILLPHS